MNDLFNHKLDQALHNKNVVDVSDTTSARLAAIKMNAGHEQPRFLLSRHAYDMTTVEQANQVCVGGQLWEILSSAAEAYRRHPEASAWVFEARSSQPTADNDCSVMKFKMVRYRKNRFFLFIASPYSAESKTYRIHLREHIFVVNKENAITPFVQDKFT